MPKKTANEGTGREAADFLDSPQFNQAAMPPLCTEE
jgi:hypothetical protein